MLRSYSLRLAEYNMEEKSPSLNKQTSEVLNAMTLSFIAFLRWLLQHYAVCNERITVMKRDVEIAARAILKNGDLIDDFMSRSLGLEESLKRVSVDEETGEEVFYEKKGASSRDLQTINVTLALSRIDKNLRGRGVDGKREPKYENDVSSLLDDLRENNQKESGRSRKIHRKQ